MNQSSPVAIITPSFARDALLCRTLVESVGRHFPADVRHYIIVPRRDYHLFQRMGNERTIIRSVEEVLRNAVFQLPRLKARWFSLAAPLPVSGWLVQQLVKIASPDMIDAATLLMVDSDVVFIRDVDPAGVPDIKTRLYRIPGGITADMTDHRLWHETGCRLLGIPPDEVPMDDYIGHVVPWNAETVRLMRARISSVTGLRWETALLRARHVSEYLLYGLFVDRVLTQPLSVWHDERKRCLSIWDPAFQDAPEDISTYASQLQPDDMAISITAHAGLNESVRRDVVAKIISAADSPDGLSVSSK